MSKIKYIALALLVSIILIHYLIIKPQSIRFVKDQLNEEFVGYIAYKNDQKGFYIYLTDDLKTAKLLKLDTMYESEAFNKPQIGKEIKHIVFTDSSLYKSSHIGDRIQKLANSNKCYLYSNNNVLKFNCYVIFDDERQSIDSIAEWQPDEIGAK